MASALLEEFKADLLPAGANVDLIAASRQDATLATVQEWIRSESTPVWVECAGLSPELRCWRLQMGNLSIDTDGRLWRRQALRDGVVPRLLSCVWRAMAIARLTHLRISILWSGAPPGQVPAECFPGGGGGGAPFVPPPRRRQVSFVDEVTLLGEEELPECSPVLPPLILPVVVEEVVDDAESEASSLILPVVEEINSGAPMAARVELVPSATGSDLPLPPGFSPFVWPVDDGGMDVDDLCARINGDCSLTLSPIGRVSSDGSDAAGSPEVGVLISPLANSSSEVTPAVGYACLPLPSVDNSLVPDLVWVPALPQSSGPYVDREFD